MKKTLLSLIPFFLLVLSGCDTTEPVDDRTPALYGTVTDSNNQPVGGAEIHYIPHLVPAEETSCYITPDFIVIQYLVEVQGNTKVEIWQATGKTPFETLVNETKGAGNHFVVFDPSKATNGGYFIRVTQNNHVEEYEFLILKEAFKLRTTSPLTRSIPDGSFTLGFDTMSISESFTKAGDGSPLGCSASISSVIDIVIHKPGYFLLVEEVALEDLSLPIDKNFVLQNQLQE